MNDKDGNCLLILISHIPLTSIMLQLLYSITPNPVHCIYERYCDRLGCEILGIE